MRRYAIAILLATAVAVGALARDDAPSVERIDGFVAVHLPITVLRSKTVRDRLHSGLTTTFSVDARAGSHHENARIEVRYDLWDEVYLVRRIDRRGKSDVTRVADTDAFETWWKAHPLRLFTSAEVPRGKLAIVLRVFPYSQSEESETRNWIGKAAGTRSETGTDENTAGTEIIDALIATSIRARPFLTYRWSIAVQP